MVINVIVQYNGGLLPDIILLTRCNCVGEPLPWFRYDEEFLSLQPMFPPKDFDYFPPEGGCSEGLDAFKFRRRNICFLRLQPAGTFNMPTSCQ